MALRKKESGWTTVEKTEVSKENVISKTWESFLSSLHLAHPNKTQLLREKKTTLTGRARPMMIQARLNQQDKRKFWCEVISTATKLDNTMVRTDTTKPPYTLFFNKDVKYMRHLRLFGEMAVVAIHEGKKMRSILDTRGKTSMFVGYADDHAGDVFRFINVQTKRIILSRDAKWLNLCWKHYKMRHNNPRRQQVELFLDEEENLSLEGNDPEENRIEGDRNNTIDQRRLGLDIGMIGAR